MKVNSDNDSRYVMSWCNPITDLINKKIALFGFIYWWQKKFNWEKSQLKCKNWCAELW